MKKIFRKIAFFLLSAILVTWIMFGPLVKGAMSVKKLNEGIYYLEFSGNDGFDGFLKKGGASDAAGLSAYLTEFLSRGFSKQPASQPQEQDFGCSTMTVSRKFRCRTARRRLPLRGTQGHTRFSRSHDG